MFSRLQACIISYWCQRYSKTKLYWPQATSVVHIVLCEFSWKWLLKSTMVYTHNFILCYLKKRQPSIYWISAAVPTERGSSIGGVLRNGLISLGKSVISWARELVQGGEVRRRVMTNNNQMRWVGLRALSAGPVNLSPKREKNPQEYSFQTEKKGEKKRKKRIRKRKKRNWNRLGTGETFPAN